MIDGFFRIAFTGANGSGFGMLILHGGIVVGADIVGTTYVGTYTDLAETQEFNFQINVTFPAGVTPVQTGTPLAAPITVPMSGTVRHDDIIAENPILLRNQLGPVNVIFKKIRDLSLKSSVTSVRQWSGYAAVVPLDCPALLGQGYRYMVREIWPAPFIAPEHYEAFRRFVGLDLPDTYHEWLRLSDKEAFERAKVGYQVERLQVNPDEFTRYCDARWATANGIALMNFVREKAAGQRY